MRRLLAVVLAGAVTACGSSGVDNTSPQSQLPNVAAMPLPLRYLDCVHAASATFETESAIGTSCWFYLEEGTEKLSPYYRSFVAHGLHARAKPIRERAIAQAAPEREARRNASAEKFKADVRQSVQKWGQCASAVIVENDKDNIPVLDLVKLAKMACGSLWQGTRGADDPLYYRMVQAFRTQSPIPTSASDPSAPIIGPAHPLPPVDKRV